jgi:hypothetical protein
LTSDYWPPEKLRSFTIYSAALFRATFAQQAWRTTVAKHHAERDRQPPLDRAAWVRMERHARTCSICRHPQRYDIERDFICWERPFAIALRSSVCTSGLYRHAHATGLFKLRRQALESRGLPATTRHIDLRTIRGIQGFNSNQNAFPIQNR